MYHKVSLDGNTSQYFAASSLHPGGLNVLMGDGSVRFAKDSIQTWPYDSLSGVPTGSTLGAQGAWVNLPPSGIWQALSTRNGSEIVTGDSY
jgi:prepilin-type processing-associated H-X9-DG protein